MKNLNYIFFVLALSFVVQVNAQQDPHFSLYKYNMNVVNPSFAGTNQKAELLFGVRSQWQGIEGAPETQNFNFNTPVGSKIGLGFTAVRDRVFVLSETHIYADFSYRIQLSETIDLFAGIKAGGSFLDVDLNSLGIDNDPLFNGNVNSFNPNVGIGFLLKAPKFYITLSAPGLLKNDRFEKEGVAPVSAVDNAHFFAGGGYDLKLSEDFMLQPSTLVKFVSGAPISIDLTASLMYREKFELGVNYRLDESYTGFLTFGVSNQFRFGYAYENTTTDIQQYSGGSHEVIIKIGLGK